MWCLWIWDFTVCVWRLRIRSIYVGRLCAALWICMSSTDDTFTGAHTDALCKLMFLFWRKKQTDLWKLQTDILHKTVTCHRVYGGILQILLKYQKCWVTVREMPLWLGNIKVPVYFGFTAVAVIWDYSAESPVWKQATGLSCDFRREVFRTVMRNGHAWRMQLLSDLLKCFDEVLQC